ncbi:hypothetical protein KGF54_004881 [Candida jiufengensis]|uniref:uncharacterized protein n=1 Tax=Candida jiufengensis TaxID=497108 RepID=UPI002223F64C|nr:uncharacterized protein KGF54_004881 [Candida jiufengensis]KAI5951806.1 hypothetical protein KGF54_004881 [Candida jiufengensis]
MGFRLSFNSISFILILVSFVFLLLATISSPIVTTFNLGKTSSHTYGIFGYCSDNNSQCSSATYPLLLSSIDDKSSNWIMNSSTRDTLAKIFILTPIALGFNFILLILIFISHFGIKPIVLIGIAINVISAILTIISCIIVILVFYPNLAWTGWILIGAAAANLISIIFMILTLTIVGSSDNDDDDEDTDLNEFGRFGNTNKYDKLDDKFNHIQTSTFKSPNSTSSLDNDYDYKPYGHNNNSYGNSSSTGFGNTANRGGATNNNNTGFSGPTGVAAAGLGTAGLASTNAYGVNKPNNGGPNGSFTSNSSSYYTKPQTVNDFTQRQNNNGSLTNINNSNNTGYKPVNSINPPYPAANTNTNANADVNSTFSRSVFEHHPQVEGHKPFTELDDDYEDEEDDENINTGRTNVIVTTNDSDEDSDFTSVSQRAPNPQYNQYSQQQQQPQQNYYNTYSNVQQYQPISQQQQHSQQHPQHPQQAQYSQTYNPQQNQYMTSPTSYNSNQYFSQNQPPQQPQQQRTTISDNVLNNNPDFNFSRTLQLQQQQQKRRVSPGFIPVAARYNNNTNSTNANASSLMGRTGGTQARSGPYGITRN